MPRYQLAAPHDLVLAFVRDGLYRDKLAQQLVALVEHCCGPIAAAAAPEISLLSDCLYYGFTTVSGTQTLGEEFCGLLRVHIVTRTRGGKPQPVLMPLSRPVRAAVCACQALAAYWTRRYAAGWQPLEDALESWASGRQQHMARVSSWGSFSSAGSDSTDASAAAGAGAGAGADAGAGAGDGTVVFAGSRWAQQLRSWVAQALGRLRRVVQWALRAREAVAERLEAWRASKWWLAWLERGIQVLLRLAARLHVIAFFFQNTFYEFAMRLWAVHYVIGRSTSPLMPGLFPGLGWLLVLELLANTASGVASTAGAALARCGFGAWGGSGADSTADSKQHDSDDVSGGVLDPRVASAATVEAAATSKRERRALRHAATAAASCVLCLRRMQHPTATPCGHVFCWDCIVRAVRTKPECPLCRQPAAPRALLCLQGY